MIPGYEVVFTNKINIYLNWCPIIALSAVLLRWRGPIKTSPRRSINRRPGDRRPQSPADTCTAHISTSTSPSLEPLHSSMDVMVMADSISHFNTGSLSSEDVERLRSLLPPELQQSGKLSHLEIIMEAISYIKTLDRKLHYWPLHHTYLLSMYLYHIIITNIIKYRIFFLVIWYFIWLLIMKPN